MESSAARGERFWPSVVEEDLVWLEKSRAGAQHTVFRKFGHRVTHPALQIAAESC